MWSSRSRLASASAALSRCAAQGRHVSHRAFGEIDGLIGRHVAAGLGGEQGLHLGGGEPLGLVGPAPVGEDLGVLGDHLAPVVAAGQLQVHAEPDQQQRGAPGHGRGAHHPAAARRAQRPPASTGSSADSRTYRAIAATFGSVRSR